MQKQLFISDVHLGGFTEKENKELENDFLNVLEWAKENDYYVWFAGDIFDYWMEFPNGYYPAEFNKVIDALVKLKEYQKSVSMITGNHDNWTKCFFPNLGIHLIEDFVEIQLGNESTVLMKHGDGLFQGDKTVKRPLFHKILRNRLFVAVFQFLFRDKRGINIMRNFSLLNRKYRPTDPQSAEKLTNWFMSLGYRLPYSAIICGHDHIPRKIRKKDTVFVNCGAFCYQRTAALTINQEIELVYWDKITKQFKPFSHNHE